MTYLDSPLKWFPIVTRGDAGWSVTNQGREWSLELGTPTQPSQVAETDWDFFALAYYNPAFVDQDTAHSPPHYGEVRGVIWAHDVDTTTKNDDYRSEVRKFGNSFVSGDAYSRVTRTEAGPPVAGGGVEYFCPECPQRVTDLFAIKGYPYLQRVMSDRMHPLLQDSEPTYTQLIIQASPLTSQRYVPASEGIVATSKFARADQPFTFGLTVSTFAARQSYSAGLVQYAWRADSFDGIPVPQPVSEPEFVRELLKTVRIPDNAFAFSATEGTVFAFGSTLDQVPVVVTVALEQLLYLEPMVDPSVPVTKIYQLLKIDPKYGFGNVLAAAYQLRDRSVYLVDELAGVRCLVRWRVGTSRTEIVVLLSPGWSSWPELWLAAGTDGGLVLAGSRSAKTDATDAASSAAGLVPSSRLIQAVRDQVGSNIPPSSHSPGGIPYIETPLDAVDPAGAYIAVLVPEEGGALIRGYKALSERLVSAPKMDATGLSLSVAVPPSGARLVEVKMSELISPPDPELPETDLTSTGTELVP